MQFKEVVPIADTSIMAKIHQTYRIQYIKDVILPRSLDDATYTTLSSLALFNNVEVGRACRGEYEYWHARWGIRVGACVLGHACRGPKASLRKKPLWLFGTTAKQWQRCGMGTIGRPGVRSESRLSGLKL